MTLARNPSISFSVPTLSVTPSNTTSSSTSTIEASRNSLDELHAPAAGAAGQLSPLALPRPPRCLTPYPDASKFPHSLEPSPLSSPAFSAYSMNVGSSGEDDDDEDSASVSEVEADDASALHVAKPITSPKPTDHARLLAPALQMSHLNSPTDVQFRQLPLSPMRKVKAGSASPSPLASPLPPPMSFTTHEEGKKRPEPITLSLKRTTPKDKVSFGMTSTPPRTTDSQSPSENGTPGYTAVPRTSKRLGKTNTAELQVHVETVD